MSLASKFSLEKKEETISTEFQNEKEKKEDEDKNDEKVITRKSLKNDEKKKTRKQKEQEEEMKKKREYWDLLRKIYTKNFRSEDYMDSVDWEAVRVAKPRVLAQTIASRGQHNIIGGRVQVYISPFFLL